MFTRVVGLLLAASSGTWAASSLTDSTYLRKDLMPSTITTDAAGNVNIAGSLQDDLDVLEGTGRAPIVVKLNPTGSAYIYTRIFGGSGYDVAQGIVGDSVGNAYVTGTAYSFDFRSLRAVVQAFRPAPAGDGPS